MAADATQVAKDAEHLRLLSIFHYVVAGINALMACIPFVHLIVGIVMVVAGSQSKRGAPPVLVGVFFIAIGAFIILLGWAMAICIFLAGRFLARRRHYMFCFVIAVLSCLSMPFGTILGVFTLIVLSRPSVKALFEGAAGSSPATQDSPRLEDPL